MDDNIDTRKKYKKIPLEYEEFIHEGGYLFIGYVWNDGVYRGKYAKGHGRYRRYIYSIETYERVKWGKYRHKYVRKRAVMSPLPKRTLKTRLQKKKRRRGKKPKPKKPTKKNFLKPEHQAKSPNEEGRTSCRRNTA